jgi:broad specificity phosphatase PhoE
MSADRFDSSADYHPMRIGLVRHFPVTEAWPSGWLTSDNLQQWRKRYEAADVIAGPIDVGAVSWQRCYSSDLKRAYLTAQKAFIGTIVQTPLLREAEFLPFATGQMRLPVWGWRALLRLAWLTGHGSQRASRDEFQSRIRQIVDLLEADPVDTLVVSHAGVMFFLRKELLRRGFQGPRFRLAKHARLYLFQES